MKLFRTTAGAVLEIEREGSVERLLIKDPSWDELLVRDDLAEFLHRSAPELDPCPTAQPDLLPPVLSQEVWAAGVTYYRSRDARMEESRESGGSDFYDRVYNADRPELFFKSTGARVVGDGDSVRIRGDASWSVPEPEFTLVISKNGRIIGYTIGNDMSSRDIEGENPLYLPQAKVYNGSCAIGPGIFVSESLPPPDTEIAMKIERRGETVFSGTTDLSQLKRTPQELVEYLYRECDFPNGALLLTGTGIVPGDDFTLESGDEIGISIDGIGTLRNTVA